MTIAPTTLPGVFVIEARSLPDERGTFVKIFHRDTFAKAGLDFMPAESYYSTSKTNVIRGMHFQSPPQAHSKLVYVTHGRILDVVLDIRVGSPTYGKYAEVELSAENCKAMFVPIGFAHGFLSMATDSCVTYVQTTQYSPEHDRGVRFDSFGKDWGVSQPILSTRDQAFPSLQNLESPFTFNQQ